MPLPKDQRGVYGNPREDFERARGALAGFTGLGEEPSVMDYGASEAVRAGELASLLSSLAGFGGLGAVSRTVRHAPKVDIRGLNALDREIVSGADAQKLREFFHPRTMVGSDTSENHKIIAGYFPEQAESYPETISHLFSREGLPTVAYQLSPKTNTTHIPNFVSFEKGFGHQALEDAYQNAKQMAPDKPVQLVSLPDQEALDFYRRQKGWIEDTEDGANRFTRKAQGGLVQTCQCKADGGEVSHSDLYQQREHGDQSVAPQEYRAFAREWTQENPMMAVPSLTFAIPGYYAAKKLGLIRSRTPASLEQVTEAYKGIGDGLASLLDKSR